MLKLKVCARVILTVNIDIQDCLINGLTVSIRISEFDQDSVWKVMFTFPDEQAGLTAMRSSYLGRQNSSVPIEKYETEILIKKDLCLYLWCVTWLY